jgi:hypothetical protein
MTGAEELTGCERFGGGVPYLKKILHLPMAVVYS